MIKDRVVVSYLKDAASARAGLRARRRPVKDVALPGVGR